MVVELIWIYGEKSTICIQWTTPCPVLNLNIYLNLNYVHCHHSRRQVVKMSPNLSKSPKYYLISIQLDCQSSIHLWNIQNLDKVSQYQRTRFRQDLGYKSLTWFIHVFTWPCLALLWQIHFQCFQILRVKVFICAIPSNGFNDSFVSLQSVIKYVTGSASYLRQIIIWF